jgi:hypothetical protein
MYVGISFPSCPHILNAVSADTASLSCGAAAGQPKIVGNMSPSCWKGQGEQKPARHQHLAGDVEAKQALRMLVNSQHC